VTQGSILGPILFLIYCADVIAIAKRHGLGRLGVHSYADDTQLYFHTAQATVDNMVQRLVLCMEEIHQWMNANRLRLNEDKTQLSEVQCQKISLRGVAGDSWITTLWLDARRYIADSAAAATAAAVRVYRMLRRQQCQRQRRRHRA